jgi:arylsulfatase A-like enzyme
VLVNVSESWGTRLRFLTGPFTAGILVLVSPWANRSLFVSGTPWGRGILAPESTLGKLAVTGALILLICAVSWIASRLVVSRAGLLPTLRFSAAFGLVIPVAIALGMSFDRAGRLPLPATAKSPQSRPNVVLLSLDTVRADHLSLYGYSRETTPHLSALAKEATVYTNAFAVSDMTLATHASIFTGAYPRRHGAHYVPSQPFGQPMADLPTLAEILSRSGYLTAGVAANYAYLDPSFGFARGFQSYDVRRPVSIFDPRQTYYLRYGIRSVLERFLPLEQFDHLCRSAAELHEEVFPMLDQLAARKNPFFLFVNYMDAHAPRMPPPSFASLFPGRDPSLNAAKYYAVVKDVMKQTRPLRDSERTSAISLYDDSLAYLDDQVAKLVDRLKALGVYENTLIVITSDHGEAFGERDLMEHSVSVYQDQIYVPLLIKYPNTHESRKVGTVVSQIDLLPTILSTVGLPVPTDLHGIDLQDRKASEAPRTVVSESYPDAMFVTWNRRFNRTETALISGHMKLVISTAGKRELYDLEEDPKETKNLYQTSGETSGMMIGELTAWLKSVVPAGNGSTPQDQDRLRQLRSLGYAQ